MEYLCKRNKFLLHKYATEKGCFWRQKTSVKMVEFYVLNSK